MIERAGDHVLIIGYGNTLRGDDAVGRLVVESIASRSLPNVTAISVTQLVPELAPQIAEARAVIFVDARASATNCDIGVIQIAHRGGVTGATHTGGPNDLMSLVKECYGRSPRAWLVAVPAAEFDVTESLSPMTQNELIPAVRS